jgi:glutaredoxin-related protein
MKIIYIPFDKHKTSTTTPFVSNLIQVGDFSIYSNLSSTKTDIVDTGIFQKNKSLTLDDISEQIKVSLKKESSSTGVYSDYLYKADYTNLTNIYRYSNLENNFLAALEYLFFNFPASLVIKNSVINQIGNNIINIASNTFSNTTEFLINTNFISNPCNLNYLKNKIGGREKYVYYYDIADNFSDYYFEVDGQKYEILEFTGSEKNINSFIKLKISGVPFLNEESISINCLIRPKEKIKKYFNDNAPIFVNTLLRNEKQNGFHILSEDFFPEGNLIHYTNYVLPKIDLYNIDLISQDFEDFKEEYTDYLRKKDDIDTNVINRKYIDANLFSGFINDQYLNAGDKLETLTGVYAYSFDSVLNNIKSIPSTRELTYNEKNNINDNLLDIYLSNLGIEVSKSLDVNKKRILGLNYLNLIKKKGTRDAILFLFGFFNIPSEFVEINEYVKKAESKINVNLLKKYYELIYGNDILYNISLDEEGNPKSRSQFIFENSDYWSQFENINPDINGKFIIKDVIKDDLTNLYNITVENLEDFQVFLPSSTCATATIEFIDNDLPTIITDECECQIIIDDKVAKICSIPFDFDDCFYKKIILDIWQDCEIDGSVRINFKIYGGYGDPYVISGETRTGDEPYEDFFVEVTGSTHSEVFPVGTEYKFKIIDASGCTSLVCTGITECYNDLCIDSDLKVYLSYTCLTSNNDIPTGEARVNLVIEGGTAPYTIIGNKDGDIVQNGGQISTAVLDANNCYSGIIKYDIVCPLNNCNPIFLKSTGECKSNLKPFATLVDVTYDFDNIPISTTINNIIMTIDSIAGGQVINGPITETFSQESGAKTININFGEVLGVVTLNVKLSLYLSNGCVYTDDYNLIVDCTNVNVPTLHTNTLIGN